MGSEADSVSLLSWILAVTPIAVLVLLVLRASWSTSTKALVTAAVAMVVAAMGFGAGRSVLGVAVGKGVWAGLWILYVIWPALLLYEIATRVGIDRMGHIFSTILPREVENVLLVAWVFPSFVQGVAGFGAPIAVAAPLLVSMGVRPVNAVAFPLIGYHWSVTFGSMGSSFYMAALTANLPPNQVSVYAGDAALILGLNMLVSGALVAVMHGGWRALREAVPMLGVVGAAMFVALNLAVRIEPSIGSLSAGGAGLLAVASLRYVRARRVVRVPDAETVTGEAILLPADPAILTAASTGATLEVPLLPSGGVPLRPTAHVVSEPAPSPPRRPGVVLLPYAYLLVAVLAVFVPSTSRAWVKSHMLLAPSFPITVTASGLVNPAVERYTPIALLGHPGTYIMLAAILGLLTYRAAGMWPDGSLRPTLSSWLLQVRHSTPSIVALTTLATVMVDAGMVRAIAAGAADVTGQLFPAVSPLIGALGSFTTGSTTTSNALFAALQGHVATLIGVGQPELLAAQTTGGNVGNSLAPVVILIGATAIGARDAVADILRRVLRPALALLLVVVVMTLVLVSVR